MLLNETFSYNIGTIKTKNGTNMRVAYIDAHRSQDTYSIRKQIQAHGAKWNPQAKWWYWILGNNPEEVINTQVKPCIEELTKIEDMGGEPKRNVEDVINKLISKVKSANIPGKVANMSSKDEILDNLENFKRDLVKITSDEEFKRMMEPIIKFRNAQGASFSLYNSILIYIQDPEATLVKSKKNWEAVNRTVKKGAKAIWLWYPVGEQVYSKEEKIKITKDFLKEKRVKNVKELTPGDKERLKKLLNSVEKQNFDLGPFWYDYRFTEQMPDTEDLVGNPNHDIKWFDDSGEETPELEMKINSILEVIEDDGITLSFVDDLGGARGVSKSGTIDILKNQPKNAGMLNTIIHEYAHEILHQRYLQSKNEEMKEYFVGTKEGRHKVEQQAELCAWIVMRNYGYDMQTNINYVGIWGLNQDNAVKVFDSVSKVATLIIQKLNEKEENNMTMAESKKYLKENHIPSGYEIAQMVGCGDIYKKSAMKQRMSNDEDNNVIKMTESDLKKVIKESVKRILSEEHRLQSSKLEDIIKQHGGIKKNTTWRVVIPYIKDEDIIGVYQHNFKGIGKYNKVAHYLEHEVLNRELNQNEDILDLELNDGNALYFIFDNTRGKYDRIHKSVYDNKTKPSKGYEWQNPHAAYQFYNKDIRTNWYGWTPEKHREEMNFIRGEHEKEMGKYKK